MVIEHSACDTDFTPRAPAATRPAIPPQVSDLPPHGVLVNPPTRAVLLALQPSAGSVEEEAAAQRAAAAAAGMRPAGGGGIGTGGGGDAMQEGEEDDVSPRTLQAAVARLAAYTSEEPVGEWVACLVQSACLRAVCTANRCQVRRQQAAGSASG